MLLRHRKRRTGDELSASVSVPVDANSRGLPVFPYELHLEILSYCPSLPVPKIRAEKDYKKSDYRTRYETARSLSQTCSALRAVYLPLAWQDLDLLPGARSNQRNFAIETIARLEMVTVRAPFLAQHVRSVSVVLTNVSPMAVYSEFVEHLLKLPNLHTLQILKIPATATCLDALKDAFEDVTLPSVHTLNIHAYEAHIIMNSFPNLGSLLSPLHLFAFRGSVARSFPTIEDLQFRVNKCYIEFAIQRFPNLRITPWIFFPAAMRNKKYQNPTIQDIKARSFRFSATLANQ
ncbi:hypothetical protein BDZ89DRAFT_1129340 [Hymenopellis radicata]|nr:hypothetical protein BDZ89DRAFT_1129340 [Hymenopellis radicata]